MKYKLGALIKISHDSNYDMTPDDIICGNCQYEYPRQVGDFCPNCNSENSDGGDKDEFWVFCIAELQRVEVVNAAPGKVTNREIIEMFVTIGAENQLDIDNKRWDPGMINDPPDDYKVERLPLNDLPLFTYIEHKSPRFFELLERIGKNGSKATTPTTAKR